MPEAPDPDRRPQAGDVVGDPVEPETGPTKKRPPVRRIERQGGNSPLAWSRGLVNWVLKQVKGVGLTKTETGTPARAESRRERLAIPEPGPTPEQRYFRSTCEGDYEADSQLQLALEALDFCSKHMSHGQRQRLLYTFEMYKYLETYDLLQATLRRHFDEFNNEVDGYTKTIQVLGGVYNRLAGKFGQSFTTRPEASDYRKHLFSDMIAQFMMAHLMRQSLDGTICPEGLFPKSVEKHSGQSGCILLLDDGTFCITNIPAGDTGLPIARLFPQRFSDPDQAGTLGQRYTISPTPELVAVGHSLPDKLKEPFDDPDMPPKIVSVITTKDVLLAAESDKTADTISLDTGKGLTIRFPTRS
ncbi:MAG: hypothetical protein Q8P95_04250 [bacterium]|nr:hypothetical protein [bacterium]